MARVERAAQRLLLAQGVDLAAVDVPEAFEVATSWTLAVVAEVDGALLLAVAGSFRARGFKTVTGSTGSVPGSSCGPT